MRPGRLTFRCHVLYGQLQKGGNILSLELVPLSGTLSAADKCHTARKFNAWAWNNQVSYCISRYIILFSL